MPTRRPACSRIHTSISDARLEGARADQARARSPLLPQLDSAVLWSDKDDDLLPPVGADAVVGVLSLTQSIYDDRLHADYKASKRAFEGTEQARVKMAAAAVVEQSAARHHQVQDEGDHRRGGVVDTEDSHHRDVGGTAPETHRSVEKGDHREDRGHQRQLISVHDDRKCRRF